MSETTATTTATQNKPRGANWGRKKIKAEGRKKRKAKIATDKAHAKAFFEAKSKRSTEKKAAYRKKKRGKK